MLDSFGRWAVSNKAGYSIGKDAFILNGYLWHICFVDPSSQYLVDRTNTSRLATTDPTRYCVFLSTRLSGSSLRTVLLHELGHCTMFSYVLLPAIHSFVKPQKWIEAEEWVCNFIADYGDEVFAIANDILSRREFVTPNEGGTRYVG